MRACVGHRRESSDASERLVDVAAALRQLNTEEVERRLRDESERETLAVVLLARLPTVSQDDFAACMCCGRHARQVHALYRNNPTAMVKVCPVLLCASQCCVLCFRSLVTKSCGPGLLCPLCRVQCVASAEDDP